MTGEPVRPTAADELEQARVKAWESYEIDSWSVMTTPLSHPWNAGWKAGLAAQAQRDAGAVATVRREDAEACALIVSHERALRVAAEQALARHEKCAEEWQANELALAERENELHAEKDARLAAAEQRSRRLEAALDDLTRNHAACRPADCLLSAARAALAPQP